jgi:KDO2-lipid IV(A) lauroyltransferase
VDALRTSRESLSRGELVAMLIDQVPARASQAVVVEFLCNEVDVDRAPASLAAAMRAPLVLAVSRRTDGVQALELLAVLEPPERGRRAWAVEATRTATRVFERWVHAHPSEWMWLHRRWRRAPGSLARKAPGSRAPQSLV